MIALESILDEALWYLKLGELDEAERRLVAYLEDHPEDPVGHNKLGIVHAERKNFTAARQCFEQALELEPNSTSALNNLGNLERETGNLAEAKVYYLKAIELDPDYAVPHNNLAVIYKQLNQYTEFVKEIKLARKLEQRHRLNPEKLKTLRQVWEKFRSGKKH